LASRSKTKTTMSKLNRERKVLEKRMEKQARKELRKLAAAEPPAETPEGPQPPASADDTG
jgi:hypothetical protein